MGPVDQLIHLLNFFAPAWGVAFFCVVFAQFAARRWLPESRWSWLRQFIVSAVLGSLVLVGGLVFFWHRRQDGHIRRVGRGVRKRAVDYVPRLVRIVPTKPRI